MPETKSHAPGGRRARAGRMGSGSLALRRHKIGTTRYRSDPPGSRPAITRSSAAITIHRLWMITRQNTETRIDPLFLDLHSCGVAWAPATRIRQLSAYVRRVKTDRMERLWIRSRGASGRIRRSRILATHALGGAAGAPARSGGGAVREPGLASPHRPSDGAVDHAGGVPAQHGRRHREPLRQRQEPAEDWRVRRGASRRSSHRLSRVQTPPT